MGGVDEDGDRVADDAGGGVEVGDAELAAGGPVLLHLPDEAGHGPGIGGDEIRAFGQDAATEAVNLGIVAEPGALAAVEREDEAAQPLRRGAIGLGEA